MKKALTAIVSLLFVMVVTSALADQDVSGGKDHPLLSRMPDFRIGGYLDKNFDSNTFYAKDAKPVSVEGHYYKITYLLNKGAVQPGALKIIRNIQDALKKVGGKVLYEGGRRSTILIQKDGRETWVGVEAFAGEYTLTVVEKEQMEQEVVANAEAMGNDIHTTGHVPVYGIHFDHGKSDIKPESEAALSEIAKLLGSDGSLTLYVVGHTDNVGSLDSNMKLSKDRANAVVSALSGKHGIAAVRLKAFGVASLSPVASNATEDGKAKNRRVELVKQ